MANTRQSIDNTDIRSRILTVINKKNQFLEHIRRKAEKLSLKKPIKIYTYFRNQRKSKIKSTGEKPNSGGSPLTPIPSKDPLKPPTIFGGTNQRWLGYESVDLIEGINTVVTLDTPPPQPPPTRALKYT